MPHICIVTTVHDPFDTRVFHRQARTLAAAGYRVTLLAQGAPEVRRDGVQLRPLPPRAFSLWRRAWGLWIAWRRALACDADAYHLHDPELTLVGALLKLSGKHVVLDVHEHVPLQILDKRYIPPLLRRPLAWLYDGWERLSVRLFDAVIAAQPIIAARFNGRAVVVGNLPDPDRFLPADPAIPGPGGTITAIYIGVVERRRGLLEVARALHRLPPDCPLHVRVIGPCPFPDFAAELRAAGGDRLSLEPPVPFEEVPALLAGAHIGLATLLPTPLNRIGWPRKVFEYMAAGLPVLRSDFPLWDAFAAEGSVTVNPLDEAAIAEALARLAAVGDLRRRLGMAGQRLVRERYRWANEADALLDLYGRLIGIP